ncbi:SCO2400 family protein [Streptomyces decoyicus]|uniref:SCO2400 family protein n=1 Tax=Streptomyces decoyicus TaxID=249567 RepID=UPI003CC90AF4
MDYCSSCRRNLNGALMCPGCGDYAADIAPPAPRQHTTAAPPATPWDAWGTEDIPAQESHPGTHRSDAARPGSGASEDATADATGAASSRGSEGPTPTGQGRAARRRQLARWKKYRRRSVATVAGSNGGQRDGGGESRSTGNGNGDTRDVTGHRTPSEDTPRKGCRNPEVRPV